MTFNSLCRANVLLCRPIPIRGDLLLSTVTEESVQKKSRSITTNRAACLFIHLMASNYVDRLIVACGNHNESSSGAVPLPDLAQVTIHD